MLKAGGLDEEEQPECALNAWPDSAQARPYKPDFRLIRAQPHEN
jgi:hypothetical protein